MPTCCGRTFRNDAALAAHRSSPLHASRSGGQVKQQKPPKKPPTARGRQTGMAGNEVVNMRVNMTNMLHGLPHLALAALAKLPTMSAEGTIWLAGMLSPNSSDLSVNLKVPDHISTRSMSNKLVKADVTLAPPTTGDNWVDGWNCLIIQLPSLDVAWLALAWPSGAPRPQSVSQVGALPASELRVFGIDRWGPVGSDAVYGYLQTQPIGPLTSKVQPNSGEQSTCFSRKLEVDGGTQFENIIYMDRWANPSVDANYSEWRLAASGMTVLFQAPALSNQGTVYGVDCGRLHSRSHVADLGYFNDGKYQPAPQVGTNLVLNNGRFPVRQLGVQAWIDDYSPATSFNQTDICRHDAKLGTYTVLYPRKSEHEYRTVSDYGALSFRTGADSDPTTHLPIIATDGTPFTATLMCRLDDSWGVKSVMYTGMSIQASLIVKTVTHVELVVDPRGQMNGLATTAFPYDSTAVDAALQFASTLPVMFPSGDNDWGGFWRKVGGFLGKVPGWIKNKATPWVKQMGQNVGDFIQTTKDAGSNVASHF